LTFHQATVRNNTSNAYRLHITGLPWEETDKYELQVQRVANGVTNSTYLWENGKGDTIGHFSMKWSLIHCVAFNL
jgi:hypothetical protein